MKVMGSILLVLAMSVGGGLLSLPAVTSSSGFFYSCLTLFLIWLIMTTSAFFILEVCLALPKGTNLIGMARLTLGIPGKLCMWFCYLVLLYCIMCVYISGGTDLINSAFVSLGLHLSIKISTLIFTILMGSITWLGIKIVDQTNRVLMSIKMLLLTLLILILFPSVNGRNLTTGHLRDVHHTILPIIFSFGFAIIIPSLCDYLDNNIKTLRMVIFIGSIIPLVCFILWIYVVQGVIPQSTLSEINNSGAVVSTLNRVLSHIGNPWVTTFIHLFTIICVLTAFLGVSLSLSDFIANGINQPKHGKTKIIIYALTFLPPLIIILYQPYLFITAIRYAGIFIVIVLIFLPALMIKRIHLVNREESKPSISKTILIYLMIILSISLLWFTSTHLL